MIQTKNRNFLFEEVKMSAPERNGFDLSHENKQTARNGILYPYEIIEALPNDDFEIQTSQYIRLNPMLSPTMHRLQAYWHWFFCPNRLTWNHWEEFISRGNGKKLPANQEYTPPESPYFTMLQMLICSPSAVTFRTEIVENYIISGSEELILEWFNSHYPNLVPHYSFLDNDEDSKVIGVFVRTPRVANAFGIVDTLFPIAYVSLSDGRVHHIVQNDGSYDDGAANALLSYLANDEDYNPPNSNFYEISEHFENTKLSSMPFVAFLNIYNDYYRDENLIEEYTDTLEYWKNHDGAFEPQNSTELSYLTNLLELHFRAWEKDYFTTATQMPQKSPDVLIPGTGSSDISVETNLSGQPSISANFQVKTNSDTNNYHLNFENSDSQTVRVVNLDSIPTGSGGQISVSRGTLSANSTVSSSSVSSPTTVAQVRRAFALQRWFEKAVRTGTRYIESLKAFFNSDAGDARLQRPEYIGGSSSEIKIADVVQTSATDDNSDTVQGNLAGYGQNSDISEVISYHAPEHGFVVGVFSILARTSYSQGIPKMFSRETWLDYAWPEFEHIGEQGIKQKELAAFPLSQTIIQDRMRLENPFRSYLDSEDEIFGYQSRYSDYKMLNDRFGSGFSSSLDFWTLGRIFEKKPTLSKEFVEARISDRNFAVVGIENENPDIQIYATEKEVSESYDHDTYECDFWIDVKKVTSLTLYSEPI